MMGCGIEGMFAAGASGDARRHRTSNRRHAKDGHMRAAMFSVLAAIAFTASAVNANLIANSDFSAGLAGFSSQYTANTAVVAEGTYSVAANPHLVHPGGASFGDHTTGTGLMLIANGAVDTSRYVWQQSIAVQTGSEYVFSGWAASWGFTFPLGVDPSPSTLRFVINGMQIGTDFTVDAMNGQWTEFHASWNSGPATNAVVRIFDANAEPTGNDFALDDLRFDQVPEPGTFLLLGSALFLLAFARRGRSHA